MFSDGRMLAVIKVMLGRITCSFGTLPRASGCAARAFRRRWPGLFARRPPVGDRQRGYPANVRHQDGQELRAGSGTKADQSDHISPDGKLLASASFDGTIALGCGDRQNGTG